LLILECFLVRRLQPCYEPPSKAEDANSPVGPLQRHVAEPYLDEWKHVDWPSFSLGADTDGVCEPGTCVPNMSAEGEWSMDSGIDFLGGLDDATYDFGRGYYPVFHYTPSKPDEDFNIC
jgi:hypothetical protein